MLGSAPSTVSKDHHEPGHSDDDLGKGRSSAEAGKEGCEKGKIQMQRAVEEEPPGGGCSMGKGRTLGMVGMY